MTPRLTPRSIRWPGTGGVSILVCSFVVGSCGGAGSASDPCSHAPTDEPALTSSSPTSHSHLAGQACLTCHGPTGDAKTLFAAAGTAYANEASRVLAAPGQTIGAVGQTTLSVDTCGNFYATASALNGAIGASQPTTGSGSRTMSLSMNRPTPNMGDCNTSGCHDFFGTSGVF